MMNSPPILDIVEDLREIQQHASNTLDGAGVRGIIPTPLEPVMHYADLLLVGGFDLPEECGEIFPQQKLDVLKRLLPRLRGLYNTRSNEVRLNENMNPGQRLFTGFHECGHKILPWQRDLYSLLVYDDDSTLNDKALDRKLRHYYECQANMYASEVLFQGKEFINRALDYRPGIGVPLKLSKEFGSSYHAALRRYVEHYPDLCALLVLDRQIAELEGRLGYRVKYVVGSPDFYEQRQIIEIPSWCSEKHVFCSLFRTQEMVRDGHIIDLNVNGRKKKFVYGLFSNYYDYFVLLTPYRNLSAYIS